VEVTQLVQTAPDEMQKAAAAMAQRAPGKYFAVRLIVGAALVALSLYESLHVLKRSIGRTDEFAHLDTVEGVTTVFAGAAYVVISWARYSDDGGALSLLAALCGVFLLALELLWKSSPLLLGPGIGESPWPQRSRFALVLDCFARWLLTRLHRCGVYEWHRSGRRGVLCGSCQLVHGTSRDSIPEDGGHVARRVESKKR
jgi:hypothetical protein